MTNKQLRDRGWRKIGTQRVGAGVAILWDHPNHQPDVHGCFTTTDAKDHQRTADKRGCDCIRTEQE